jgi:hypothetical protein
MSTRHLSVPTTSAASHVFQRPGVVSANFKKSLAMSNAAFDAAISKRGGWTTAAAVPAAHLLGAMTQKATLASAPSVAHQTVFNIAYHDQPKLMRWNTWDHDTAFAKRVAQQHLARTDWHSVCDVLHVCSSPKSKQLLMHKTPLNTHQLADVLHHYKDLTYKQRTTLMNLLFNYAYEYHDTTVIKLLKGYGLADHLYPWRQINDLRTGTAAFKHQWLSLARARFL